MAKKENNSAESIFKDLVWSQKGKDYFKKIYLKDKYNNFFKNKKTYFRPSDRYYISDRSLISWAREINNLYSHQENYCLLDDLLEVRSGQFSNGTLYSSSRLIAEMFRTKENRKKLLKIISEKSNIDTNPENYKWYLEYRLKIEDMNNSVAQMDLVAEHKDKDLYICLESKMMEIYKNHPSDFRIEYYNKSKLKEFDEFFDFTPKIVTETKENKETGKTEKKKVKVMRATIKGKKNNLNFYFKQQICHLLGIRSELNKSKVIFANFVFNPEPIISIGNNANSNKILKKYEDYLKNEKLVMYDNHLSEHFNNNIEYFGLIKHTDILNK